MKQYFSFFASLICLAVIVSSCSDEDNTGTKPFVGSKIISMNIKAKTDKGQQHVKGITPDRGGFDNVYTPDYIYIHKKGSNDVIEVPVYRYSCDETECDKGFRYHIDVREDGSATIIPFDANDEQIESKTLELSPGDSVYFSSWPTNDWTLPDEQISVYNEATLYYRKNDINKEIYRSVSNFSINDLTKNNNNLQIQRGCACFNVLGLFYDPKQEDKFGETTTYLFNENTFQSVMGSPSSTWYIKVMIGGDSFTNTFDYNTNKSTGDTSGGYYTSGDSELFTSGNKDQSMYLPFSLEQFGQGKVNYRGAGYYTRTNNELFTPVTGEAINVYILVKHWTGEGEPSEEWLKNDNGALRTLVDLDAYSSKPTNNSFYTIGLLMDIRQFKAAWDAAGGDEASEEAAGAASIASKGLSTAGVRDFTLPDARVVFEAY